MTPPFRFPTLGIVLAALIVAPLLVLGAAGATAPEPNPPRFDRPVSEILPPRAARPAADPALWSIGELSDEEQKIVELINRARVNPTAEVLRLQALMDPDVVAAYEQFGVDFVSFAADMATRPATPPLTPQVQLTAAARGHSQYQLDNAVQSHSQIDFTTGAVLNGIVERINATGYVWMSLRESVFSQATDMEYAHAGFEVDWGFGPGGQQSPPGHRDSNHDGAVTEIGPGVIEGSNSLNRGGTNYSAGPRVVTLDFGAPNPLRTYITGVAYYDVNGDGEYDEGEGLPDVRVEVGGAAFFARTTRAGGFGVPTADGSRAVTFSGANLAPVTRTAVVSGNSVKMDLRLPYAAPLLVGSANPAVGAPNVYQPAAFPSATAYEWRAARRVPFVTLLGAEGGVVGFTPTTTGTYTPRTTATRAAGAASYRLVHATSAEQILTQTHELAALAGATLRFSQRFGFSTATSIAAVEISTDGGAGWNGIWSRPGLGEAVEPSLAFQSETVPLGLPVGTAFRVRFRYFVQPGGSFFNQQMDERVGFFFDEVSYSGVAESLEAGGGEVAAGTPVIFQPSVAGEYVLQARPKIGSRVYPFRESITLLAQTGSGVVDAVTRITGAAVGANGKLRVDFSVLGGTAAGFDLERSALLGGAWSRDTTAVLSTNSPGQLTFRTTPGGAAGFLRIRAR